MSPSNTLSGLELLIKRGVFIPVFLFICQISIAQDPVSVMPVVAAPYSPYLADYTDKAAIQLTNHTSQRQELKLVGFIENSEGYFVRTKESWQPARPIILQAFESRIVYASRESQSFLDPRQIETNVPEEMRIQIQRLGLMPEGEYTFCVQALNHHTGAPLSAEAPVGCTPIFISYPEPPLLVFPSCEEVLQQPMPTFQWMTPAGLPMGIQVKYDFYLLKLLPGQEPNDAMQLAVQYGAGNPFIVKNLSIPMYNYQVQDIPLIKNASYAWQVIARDPQGKVFFQNEGKSEVCSFLFNPPGKFWNDPPQVFNAVQDGDDDDPEEDDIPEIPFSFCATECAFDMESPGFLVDDPYTAVNIDSIIKLGTFDMRIISLNPPNPLKPGTISGTGLIPVPFVNHQKIRVRVDFDTLMINTELRAIAGTAKAKVQGGIPSLVPEYDQTDWDGFSLGGASIFNMKTWIEDQIDSAKQELWTVWDTYGWEMPLGYGMAGHSLAITQMHFTPVYAQFSAVAVVNLPNYSNAVTPLALGAGSICFSSSSICKEGKLFLAQPFGIDLTPDPGMELTLLPGTPDMTDSTGTFITFDTSGIGIFHLEADYAISQNKLTRADSIPGPVILHFEATMDSLSHWLFSAVMPDFYITGNKDFKFMPDTVFIDLSKVSNPPAPSQDFKYVDLFMDPTWQGVFCKQLAVQALTPLNNSSTPAIIMVKDLFIDTTGVTADIVATNLIDLTKGQLSTFHFSVDSLYVQIQHNSFVQGGFKGDVLINIADRDYSGGLIVLDARTKRNLIPFTCAITNTVSLDLDDTSGNKELKYQFVMAPADSIEVPIWYFSLNLNANSNITIENISTGKFRAQALLHGDFGIHINTLFTGSNFAGIQFQNMGLISDAPYFQMGSFGMKLASPQHSLSGFPVNLNGVKFVQDTKGNPGVEFDLGLKLSDLSGMLPAATTKFALFGRLDFVDGKVKPAFDHFEMREICLDGKLSVLHVKGCITFFYDDAVYGDGFRGNLQVDFPPEISLAATVQFGNVNKMNYWYADAMAILPQGIPLFAGLEAFGFGGGAYYHMKRTPEIAAYDMQSGQNFSPASGDEPAVGFSPSGVVYVPDPETLFGLKAKVYMGTTGQRDVFNADIALEVAIDSHGGIASIFLDGNARFVSEEDMSKGVVTAQMKAGMDFGKKLFHANISAELELPAIKASGLLELHFDGGQPTTQWYIRLGRPIINDPSKWVNLTIAGFYKIETYFQVGNTGIDDMPPPPAFISDLVSSNQAKQQSARDGLSSDYSFSLIHGGRSGFKTGGKFLIFYAELEAGYGYDLMLQKLTKGCGGVGDASSVGMNGWYAQGQAYAGIRGEIGIELDLGFASGKYSIAEIGAAAVIHAGLVNPTWVEGKMKGFYSLFGGSIKGEYYYEFAVGDKCVQGDPDPLLTMQLISDVYPAHQSQNVQVTDIPAIGTNLKMNQFQTIHMKQTMPDKSTKHRLFRFSPDLVHMNLTTADGTNVPTQGKVLSADQYGLSWTPSKTLNRLTSFTMKVTAYIEECDHVEYSKESNYAGCNGNWNKARRNNVEFKEEKTITFKTNAGLDSIPESLIEVTLPYPLERSFVWQDVVAQPMIRMSQGFNPNSYKINNTNGPATFEARFIALNQPEAAQKVVVQIPDGAYQINMSWPGTLQPETYYSIQLLARPALNSSPNSNNDFTKKQVTDIKSHQNSQYAIVSQTALVAQKLTLPPNAHKLYEIRFKTSKYPNVAEKLKAMQTTKAVYNVFNSGVDSSANVAVTGTHLSSPASIVAQINKQMNFSASTLPTLRYMPEIWMNGPERFDYYDIRGYYKKMPSGKEIIIPPFVQYQNAAIHDFHTKLMQELYKTLMDEKLAKISIPHTGPFGDQFVYRIEAPYSTNITWDEYKNPVSGQGGFQIPVPGRGGRSLFPQANPATPHVIKYITELSGRGPVPVAMDPNIFLTDVLYKWHWRARPADDDYLHFLQRLGIAYDIIRVQWTQIGVGGVSMPVVQIPGGGSYQMPAIGTTGGGIQSGKR